METAICFECFEDAYLREIVSDEGEPLKCISCGSSERNAITVKHLGEILEPIMREQYVYGPVYKTFGDDDSEGWEQQGETLAYLVYEVLGQDFDFSDEIVAAVMKAENGWPPSGDECYWDTTSLYVHRTPGAGAYMQQWSSTLIELKHFRRFFSPAAQELFQKLFAGVENLGVWKGNSHLPVVRKLRRETTLYRTRIYSSKSLLREIFNNPFKNVGPPPLEHARAGRMNAEGVVVLYGALEIDTCLAEMRPSIGNDLAVISLKTTKALRILDFVRLEEARSSEMFSHIRSDYMDEMEKRAFLKHLHGLISEPIIPGREADYIITQTMAEYLAHVYDQRFDGILFASAQRPKGKNIVLFSDPYLLTDSVSESFHVEYVEDSLQLFSTTSIKHKHRKLDIRIEETGEQATSQEDAPDLDVF